MAKKEEFIEDKDEIGDDGFKKSKYTLYIMPPIYPDKEKSFKENRQSLGIVFMGYFELY